MGRTSLPRRGAARIDAEVSRIEAALKAESNVLLRETLERDLRYWAVKKARAQIVPAPAGDTVAFGSRVTIARNGKRQSLRIVGEDEADPREGLVSWRSPLAQAILGARAGDVVEMKSRRRNLRSLKSGISLTPSHHGRA